MMALLAAIALSSFILTTDPKGDLGVSNFRVYATFVNPDLTGWTESFWLPLGLMLPSKGKGGVEISLLLTLT